MKSDHKHEYIQCLIEETVEYGHKPYTFWYLGYKCIVCGKLQKTKWWALDKDIPEDVKKLPKIVVDATQKEN